MKAIQFGFDYFRTYASDTAWILHKGLEAAGFELFGMGFGDDETDIQAVCEREKPDIVFVHSWDTWRPEAAGKRPAPADAGGDVALTGYRWLAEQPGILRVTQYADPRPERSAEHEEWQNEVFRPHVILCRYHLDNICELNPWLRRDALLRIWHSVTADYCAPVRDRKGIAIFAGCSLPAFYPVRHRLAAELAASPLAEERREGHGPVYTIRPHHKWARGTGPDVPAYMAHLAEHRVAVMTGARWHWALKKHWEATAAGCIVVTTAADADPLPWIDDNLVRIPDDIALDDLTDIVQGLAASWDIEKQRHFAREAVKHFDYRVEGCRIGAQLRAIWRERIADAEPAGVTVGDSRITDPDALRALRAQIDAALDGQE